MKKYILHTTALLFIVLTFTACSVKSDLFTKEIDRDGIDLVVTDESSKIAYLKNKNSLEKFCASREIDSIRTTNEGVGFGVNTGLAKDDISASDSNGAVVLGGRSPAVLITREMLFRACELTMNLELTNEQTINVYKMFLEFTNKLIKNEHDQGSKTAVSPPNTIDTKVDINMKQKSTSSDESNNTLEDEINEDTDNENSDEERDNTEDSDEGSDEDK